MILTSLYSGSSGNCLLLEHRDTKILIDAGLSGNKIQKMLEAKGVKPCSLDAIFVTHEHDDHINGVGVLSRRFDLPIYANANTMKSVLRKAGKIKEEHIRIFNTNDDISFKDIQLHSFRISHDAVEPVGFKISDGRSDISIATDIGIIDDNIRENLLNCEIVFLESNHDVDMLMNGSYPYYLKQRIRGESGHLSNDSAGEFCCDLIQSGTKKIMLGHLSQHNNTPMTALKTVKEITAQNGMVCGKDYQLNIALRDGISESLFCEYQ